MGGEVALVVASGGGGAGWFEHQDGCAGERGLVLDASGDDEEDVAAVEYHGGLAAAGVADRDIELAVKDQEKSSVSSWTCHTCSPSA